MPRKQEEQTRSTSDTAETGAGAGVTGVGAQYRSAGAETTSDIGQAEAYLLQLKRLVAGELDIDSQLRNLFTSQMERSRRNAEDFDQQTRAHYSELMNLALQSLQNAVHGHNRRNNIASTLDVQSLGENPFFQDALDAAVAKYFTEKAGDK